MLEFAVFYLVGTVIGFILGKILSRPKAIGTIRIDRSDDDGPYLFLELDQPIHTFENEKHVYVEINNADYLPRN